MLLLSAWAHSSRKSCSAERWLAAVSSQNLLQPITEFDHGSQGLISVR
jgi:hypothetical protein